MKQIAITDDLVTYLLRYGGRCRECADNFGLCPNRPLPCSGADKTIRHILEAYNYGVEHGFISGDQQTGRGAYPPGDDPRQEGE